MKFLLSRIQVIILFLFFGSSSAYAQLPATDQVVLKDLKKHIEFLADDNLKGRLVGSKGEKIAYKYIISNMKRYGLKPAGTDGFLQEFKVKKNLNNPHAGIDSGATLITGHNVTGYLDNKAANTIVIGAHFDHLGYNEYGGSTLQMGKNTKPQIHNGADDNASGTAALLLLSDILSKGEFRKNNYLFIAFSGEEEGLLGSNYYTKHPTIDTSKITYMINMDMLGRLDTSKNTFSISGTGTSPVWNNVLANVTNDGIKIKMDQSGTGPSDHTSFYNIGIPVLHFFTGTHYDYHKPSDDADKINYNGELSVIKYIYSVIGKLDNEPKLPFTKTKEDTAAKVSFKVTLGIMPDYLFEGPGVGVDGVTEGKPAAKAGIKRGDIIIQLGEIKTDDMKMYMKALSNFSKGQTTKVKVKRSGKEEEFDITF